MLVISTQKYLPFNCLKRDQPIYYLPLLHTIRTEEKFGLLHRTVLMTNLHIQWKHFLLIILTNASLSLLLRFLFFLLLLLHCRLCNSLWPNPPLAIVNINIILCTKLILIKFIHIWQVYSMEKLWPATINIYTCFLLVLLVLGLGSLQIALLKRLCQSDVLPIQLLMLPYPINKQYWQKESSMQGWSPS